jgi:type IV secretory pathway TraG/TraD family ATPase VirD4
VLIRQSTKAGQAQAAEENLINADRVRTLSDDQALLLFANKKPLLLRTTPFFRNRRLKALTGKEPWNPVSGAKVVDLKFIDLAQYRRR